MTAAIGSMILACGLVGCEEKKTPVVVTPAPTTTKPASDAMKDAGKSMDKAADAMKDSAKDAAKAVDRAADTTKDAVKDASDAAGDALTRAKDSGVMAFQTQIDAMKKQFTDLKAQAAKITDPARKTAADTEVSNVEKNMTTLGTQFDALKTASADQYTKLSDGVKATIVKIGDGISSLTKSVMPMPAPTGTPTPAPAPK